MEAVSRRVIVVDCETTGLDLDTAMAVEVAWWDLDTDQRGCFIPPHDISGATIEALEINGYYKRIEDQPTDVNYADALALHHVLRGQVLAGSNPSFDAHMLRRLFTVAGFPATQPWHHRMLDLSAYAAGVLELDPTDLLGLAKVADLLGIPAVPDHTAEGDVQVTGLCFEALFERTGW